MIGGHPPALDLGRERALHDLLFEAARSDVLASAHDCAEGGVAIALAEAAIGGGHGFGAAPPAGGGAGGGQGFACALMSALPAHVGFFSESPSRAVVSVVPACEDAL